MTGDRHVIVVDQQLHVQVLSHRKSGGFGIVAFHLRTVRTQHKNNFAWIGNRDAVDEGPHVSESTRRKLYARSKTAFRMSRKMRQVFAVVVELFYGQLAFERGHQILSRHAVASLIKEDRQDIRSATGSRMFHKAMHNADFRNRIERAARMASQSLGICNGSEEDNGVAADVDIFLERFSLFRRQFRVLRIQRQFGILAKGNRKLGNRRHLQTSPSFFD